MNFRCHQSHDVSSHAAANGRGNADTIYQMFINASHNVGSRFIYKYLAYVSIDRHIFLQLSLMTHRLPWQSVLFKCCPRLLTSYSPWEYIGKILQFMGSHWWVSGKHNIHCFSFPRNLMHMPNGKIGNQLLRDSWANIYLCNGARIQFVGRRRSTRGIRDRQKYVRVNFVKEIARDGVE